MPTLSTTYPELNICCLRLKISLTAVNMLRIVHPSDKKWRSVVSDQWSVSVQVFCLHLRTTVHGWEKLIWSEYMGKNTMLMN
jgi:hypothetical protein